jgi:hypothetical protein
MGLLALIGSSVLAAPTAASAAPAEKYRIFVFTSGAPGYAEKGIKVIRARTGGCTSSTRRRPSRT